MKSHHTYAGDPRHHAGDIAKLKAEILRLETELEEHRETLRHLRNAAIHMVDDATKRLLARFD